MGIDRRRKARAGASVWLYRLCLGACAIVGPPSLQAQTLPAHRPTALEQLRAVVGLEPAGVRRVAEPGRPGAIRFIPSPSLPKAPEQVAEIRGPIRLDRVGKIVDVLAILNRATAPGAPPLLPVEALAPAREIVPAVLEMPTPKPAPVADVPAPAPGAAGAVTSSAGPWESVGVVLCLVLIGTLFLAAVFLVARRAGLTIRLRVSLGSPAQRAGI